MTTFSKKKVISQAGSTGINMATTAALALKLNITDTPIVNDFRLTLTTGVAVTTGDVVGAATIYCTPFNGKNISLYDGTNWNLCSSAEFSLALGVLTKGVYDVFCYSNAGVPTLEFLVWTNNTTRATALTLQNGVLVKTGATTRRYLGTFYNQGNVSSTVTITNASPAVVTYTTHGLTANTPIVFTNSGGGLPTGIVAGQTYYLASLGTATVSAFNISATPGGALINTSGAGSGTHTATISTYVEDSLANRYLWNNYNQSGRRMYAQENATTWDYTTATRRQTNANILNQLNFIQGINNIVYVNAKSRAGNSSAGVAVFLGIGLDQTASQGSVESSYVIPIASIGLAGQFYCELNDYSGIGVHFLAMIEFSAATGTTRWASAGIGANITGILLG